jgi:hypothetical protein
MRDAHAKYEEQNMFEIIIIVGFLAVVCLAWVVWTESKSKQTLDKDTLDQAWRDVLDDPHHAEQRHYEERKRVVDHARAVATDG